MAGEVVSAGTFVAAVLEQAGYLTQGDFIVAFKSFFRDAGALVYFIGAIGGLISVVVFGSFRAPRYLIIGPALYWFLVGPTVEVGGVVAKLGGGEPRGFVGVEGLAGAQEDVKESLEKAGQDTGRPVRVAQGFWLFAHPINDFVNEFVGVMLKHEDGADLMVENKVRGLELIARSLPTAPNQINILEQELMVYCPQLYQSALGIAQNYVKARAVEGISSNSIPATEKYQKTAGHQWDAFFAAGKTGDIPINSRNTAGLHQYITGNHTTDRTKQAWAGQAPEPVIKCTLAWDIFLELMWAEAANRLPNMLALTVGAWDGPEAMQKACEMLTTKIYDDAPVTSDKAAKCDLQPGVTLALLANHLGYMDTFQRLLKRHQNTEDPLNPKAHSSIMASSTLMAQASEVAQSVLMSTTPGGGIGLPIAMVANTAKVWNPNSGTYVAVTDYAPAVQMNLIHGITNTEQVGLPIYMMTTARKDVYAKAMHMPYYQGICLYLIAVMYPFLALLVLLPGKAQVFINVPLAWLWVKSWDIGFAALVLLERVMYNLLPNFSLDTSLRTTEAWDWKKLPIILGEGFNFNHVQNIAQYYTILAMAASAIPVLTGIIVLKAKKAVLGSFVGAIESTSRASAGREAGKYSIAASTERSDLRARIEGVAKQMPILGAGGVEAGTRATAGKVMGALSVAANSPNILTAENWQGAIKAGTGNAKKFMEAYSTGVSSALSFESNHRGAFDPMFGRWGLMQMSADAYAAALDGAGTRLSGGFETNAATGNNQDAHIKMISGHLSEILKIEGERAREIGKAVGANLNLEGSKGAFLGGYFLKEGYDLFNEPMANQLEKALAEGEKEYAKVMQEVSAVLAASRETPGALNLWQLAYNVTSGDRPSGYETSVELQRIIGFSAETSLELFEQYNNPSGTDEEKDRSRAVLASLVSQGGIFGDYFEFMLADSTRKQLATIPGGASDQHFYGFGGNRSVYETVEDENGNRTQGKLIGGSDLSSDGFFTEQQNSISHFSLLGTLGIQWDQEAIFINQRILTDSANLEHHPREYQNDFFGIAKFMESEIAKNNNADAEPSHVFRSVLPTLEENAQERMKVEAHQMIGFAKELSDGFEGERNRFKLPSNIDSIADSNPLLAAQITANFYETLNEARKVENDNLDFMEGSKNVYSTRGEATRGSLSGNAYDRANRGRSNE